MNIRNTPAAKAANLALQLAHEKGLAIPLAAHTVGRDCGLDAQIIILEITRRSHLPSAESKRRVTRLERKSGFEKFVASLKEARHQLFARLHDESMRHGFSLAGHSDDY